MPKRKSDRPDYWDLGIFCATLLLANLLWKAMVRGEESYNYVTWFGQDVTAFFDYLSAATAEAVYRWVHLLRPTLSLVDDIVLAFDNGVRTVVVWACTPVKQSFIWLCLILCTRRLWLHKIWAIPVGWIAIWFINILRIGAICLLIEHHPEWFHFIHVYLFKYLFYGIMFLMWVGFTRLPERARER